MNQKFTMASDEIFDCGELGEHQIFIDAVIELEPNPFQAVGATIIRAYVKISGTGRRQDVEVLPLILESPTKLDYFKKVVVDFYNRPRPEPEWDEGA